MENAVRLPATLAEIKRCVEDHPALLLKDKASPFCSVDRTSVQNSDGEEYTVS